MRKPIDPQLKLGEVNIAEIEFNLKSRDEIPQLLLGLQYVYCTTDLRNKVFGIMASHIGANSNMNTGRPGMDLWTILVLGTIRLNCNWDYDKLENIADNHMKIREMLGITPLDATVTFPISTLRENIRLLTPELLEEINVAVVQSGHSLLKKNGEDLNVRCDSFVLETNVDYPIDTQFLYDSIRKMVEICGRLGLPGWRQWNHRLKNMRALVHIVRNSCRSKARDPKKKQSSAKKIEDSYANLISEATASMERIEESRGELQALGKVAELISIDHFMAHADRQIDQIRRRVFDGEKIPHDEKIFSIFQPHTRWISKGKAGVPVELGLPVCILEDQHRFILVSHVMETEVDVDVAVLMVEKAQDQYPTIASCSFDKGFHSPANQVELAKILDRVTLPKKGRPSKASKERESTTEFKEDRQKHSQVESAINALENHGLDRCRDHGIDGFKRYVGLAIVARNLQRIGAIIIKKKRESIRKIAA